MRASRPSRHTADDLDFGAEDMKHACKEQELLLHLHRASQWVALRLLSVFGRMTQLSAHYCCHHRAYRWSRADCLAPQCNSFYTKIPENAHSWPRYHPTTTPALCAHFQGQQHPARLVLRTTTMASFASKRKRDANDIPQARVGPGMDANQFESHYNLPEDDGMGHHQNDMGFAALASHNADVGDSRDMQQQQQDHSDMHGHHHMGQQPGQSASDTAAAAMAQYHTMTVPQSTEQAFQDQLNNEQPGDRATSNSTDQGNMGGQPRTPSFGDYDQSGPNDGMPPPNGAGSPTRKGANNVQGTLKPQVGTEEWHKIRRDNHKEGEYAGSQST